jgi:hypothetical protein
MPERPRPPRKPRAALPDRHVLYQKAVQAPDTDIDFVDSRFRRLRGRTAARLREDFCGTALTCCEWVRRRRTNTAVGLDLHQPTLDWGQRHNIAKLIPHAAARLKLLRRDVLRPGPGARGMDAILAMNFSWWTFRTRRDLLAYFRAVRRSLVRDGAFVLDIYGGYEAQAEVRERTQIGGKQRGFTYIWDEELFEPITQRTRCHIDFKLRDGRRMNRAFAYDWRLWSIPETRDVLADAGFKRTIVYWEGEDGKGGGDGAFRPATRGECCASFIAYIVALK